MKHLCREIKFNLAPNLWYTFAGTPQCGLGGRTSHDYKSTV